MRLSCLSFALIWASSLAAADFPAGVPFNDAVQEQILTRPLRPVPDKEQRYFLPGSTQEGVIPFLELDLRADLDREELKGRVRRRVDYYPGGLVEQSEVLYDAQGRRTGERIFDKAGQVLFERRYLFDGGGAVPRAMAVTDGNGVTQTAVDWVLDSRGMPLEEDHTDFQGLPLLHRAYRYDGNGRLVSFKETHGAAIRGLSMAWDYDHRGHLIRRRVRPEDIFAPIAETCLDVDWDSGRLVQRSEYQDNLPAGDGQTDWPEASNRRRLLSRIRFEGEEAFRYFNHEQEDTNNAFWAETWKYQFNAGGWLDEEEHSLRNGDLITREFWTWDPQQSLQRHELWGSPGSGSSAESFDYGYDAQGNWIHRKSPSDDESVERKFEYFEE